MPSDPSDHRETVDDEERAREARLRPLVAPDLVRRWAAQAGVVVGDGPLDDATVDLYLYWHDRERRPHGAVDEHVDRPARPVPGAAPPVSPALLQAASCTYDPEPCPACGGTSSLTYVDLPRAIQRQRCHSCGRQWTSAIARALA